MIIPQTIAEHDQIVWDAERWFGAQVMEYTHAYIHRVNPIIGMHACTFYEINIVMEGQGRHYFDKGSLEVLPGSVFVVPPHVRHGYWTGSSLLVFHALVHTSFFDQYDRELRRLPGFTMLCEIEPYIRNEFTTPFVIRLHSESFQEVTYDIECLIRLEQSKYKGREVMKNTRLLYLIAQLSSFAATRWRKPERTPDDMHAITIAQSMEYIRSHSHLKLKIDDLAEREHMSRSNYLRYFKQICGCTPAMFITQCRMAHARKLLCYTNLPIVSVSLECGFYDSSHFIRVFTQQEGMNPSDFRILHINDANYAQCTLCVRK